MFNRFYTEILGLLDGHLLESAYSLAEGRVLYEIFKAGSISATQLMATLNIDKGYLSRMLKKFEKNGLIAKTLSASDARVNFVGLTGDGLTVFHKLNHDSNEQIDRLIDNLPLVQQDLLVTNMKEIMSLLSNTNM